jgi:hypothetical protein
MSGYVRRAFPFRIDMRAIQRSRELTIVQNQTCRYLTRTENCARTYQAGRRRAELRDRQGIFAIKSPASYRAPLFLFWLNP